MDEHSAFLNAIIADPDNDTPRLVYADWLEEFGDPARAEFIRLQIVLAHDRETSLLRRERAFRARQLLEQHKKRWLEDVCSYCFDHRFRAGFVEKLGLLPEHLEEDPPPFRSTPLRRLTLRNLAGDVTCLSAIPAQNQLTGLDLCGNDLTARSLRELATFTHLGHLGALGLLFNRIDDEGARVLCELPFFQRLVLIRCGANPMSEAAREMLRERFGERVSFVCERDEDHLYAFQDDCGFRTGFGPDHVQFLLLASDTEMRLASFDHEGNLLGTERRHIGQQQPSTYQEQDAHRERTITAWLDKLGFQSATIKVKRFRFSEAEGISDFSPFLLEAGSEPNNQELADGLRFLDRWLSDGQFVYDFGRDNCFLDQTGVVTDT